MKRFSALIWCTGFACQIAFAAAESISISVAPNVDVPVTRYHSNNQRLILWLPSEVGVVQPEHDTAAKLARRGYSVWVADVFGARFLSLGLSSMDEIPAADVAGLIQAAQKKYRKIILVSSGRGAAVALSGVQGKHPPAVAGAVLLFPNLLTQSPEAGEKAEYLPLARQTCLPVVILQGDKSPWHWQLDGLKQQLMRGGSRVFIQHLPGMRDRFYFREDALPGERELGARLDRLILDALKKLSQGKSS